MLLCALLGATTLGAQERYGDNTPEEYAGLPGVEFHHIARTHQKIDLVSENSLVFTPVLRGVALTAGHSFLVHEKPLARIILNKPGGIPSAQISRIVSEIEQRLNGE